MPPYDIFVRWKSLEEQPLGWQPDLNHGVRLNSRPFLLAKGVGKKGAGILRARPNIKWDLDRRKEPHRDLAIVTKDADFSDRVVVSVPPPRVVHIRFGNTRMRNFHSLLSSRWPRIVELSPTNRRVRIYQDRIEAIE